MDKNRIKLNGIEYPAYPTMGAMLHYRNLTGREVNDERTSMSDMITYMYCCCRSASAREGVEFPFKNAEAFADYVLPEDFNAWATQMSGSPEENDEKKTAE